MQLRYWVLDGLSGHNSMIYFVDEVGPSAAAQSVAICDLPLRDVGQNPVSFYFVYFRP